MHSSLTPLSLYFMQLDCKFALAMHNFLVPVPSFKLNPLEHKLHTKSSAELIEYVKQS